MKSRPRGRSLRHQHAGEARGEAPGRIGDEREREAAPAVAGRDVSKREVVERFDVNEARQPVSVHLDEKVPLLRSRGHAVSRLADDHRFDDLPFLG